MKNHKKIQILREKNYCLEKLIKNLQFLLISLFIIFIGGFLNFIVITNNGGKMPVYFPYNIEDSDHFSFINYSEIRCGNLVDKYPIGNTIYSIGDLFLYSGFFLTILTLSFYIYNIMKYYKIKKYEKTKSLSKL